MRPLRIDPKRRGALEYSGELYPITGDLPKAEERLAALDKACCFSCEEYRNVKGAVERYKAAGNKYVAAPQPRPVRQIRTRLRESGISASTGAFSLDSAFLKTAHWSALLDGFGRDETPLRLDMVHGADTLAHAAPCRS